MSSEIDFAVSSSTRIAKEIVTEDVTYQRQIIKRVVQFIGVFYMVFGVFIAYVWTSKELDVKSRNSSVVYYFWDPVAAIYSLGNITVFVMILLNKYWSYNTVERRKVRKPENHTIVCFMLIPLFVSSSIFYIIKIVRDISIIPCHGYLTFLIPFSVLALITGAAILIFDVGYFAANQEDWKKVLIKSHLIFFTVIGVTNSLIISVALQHMNIFRNESYNSTYGDRFKPNESCVQSGKIASFLDTTFKKSDQYLRPTFILFCVCSLAYLIQPLMEKRHDGNVFEFESLPSSTLTIVTDIISESEENLLPEEDVAEINVDEKPTVSYRLPSASLVLCITFLSLSFLSFIIMYSLRQTSGNHSHNQLGSLIFCSFIVIVYGIGIGLSIVHIIEIKRWPTSSNIRGKIIDKCLIWIGAGGQLGLSLTFICQSIILLANRDPSALLTALLCMVLLSNFLVILQTFFQTIQISLLLERKWIRPKINSLAESMCPAVGMMGLNMGLLLLSIDQLKSPILTDFSKIMFVDMFVYELKCVGETLSILQRLHASLLFASMIVYTHN